MSTDRVMMRPFCASIGNSLQAWPLVGLTKADTIVEVETEGGITRLYARYTDTREVTKIKSFRSLRSQAIEAVFPLDPIFECIGASIDAEQMIAEYNLTVIGMKNDPADFYYFDEELYRTGKASEHCWFTSGLRIDQAVTTLHLRTESKSLLTSYFPFVPVGEQAVLRNAAATNVSFPCSGDDGYNSEYRYDDLEGIYFRYQHGQIQHDTEEDKTVTQLAFMNVFILYCDVTRYDGSMPLINVDYSIGGTGYYFSRGRFEKFTWNKPTIYDGFTFTREDGQQLDVNCGKSILCVVDKTYEKWLVIR